MSQEKTALAVKTLRDKFGEAVAADLLASLAYYENDDRLDFGACFAKVATFFRIEGAMTAALLLNDHPDFEKLLEGELFELQCAGQKSLEALRPLLARAQPSALAPSHV